MPAMPPVQPMPPAMVQPPLPADASDAQPTRPRQLPPMPPMPPMAGPGPMAARPGGQPIQPMPRSREVPQFQAPSRGGSQVRKRSFLRPWMVIVAILLAAAVAGVVIAMSGPNVAVKRGK